MTLVIMAAGMGSRYGGLKQLDPITEHGEFIIDFSIFDAKRAGFDKVVFIIKKENYDAFIDTVGSRIGRFITTEYVFQEIDNLPEGFTVPDGRVKPWGTAHAVLCAEKVVGDDCFAVINADDFYGKDAYAKLAEFFNNTKRDVDKAHFAMVGYVLKNTLTENGHVSRGECISDENGMLTSVTERTKILRREDGKTAYCEDEKWTEISEDTVVSMNCWGFTPELFGHLKKGFCDFLENGVKDPMKSEYYLPTSVMEMMQNGGCDVKLLETDARWYGVTYHEDKKNVTEKIKNLVDRGEYPDGLWK